jgi:hypothetical protein
MAFWTKQRRHLLYIIANSILLSAGLLLLIFTCILHQTGWPLLCVVAFVLAISLPLLSGSFQITEEEHDGYRLSWVLAGILIVVGYTVPIELFRKGVFSSEVGLIMTICGGTAILMAIMFFSKIQGE